MVCEEPLLEGGRSVDVPGKVVRVTGTALELYRSPGAHSQLLGKTAFLKERPTCVFRKGVVSEF